MNGRYIFKTIYISKQMQTLYRVHTISLSGLFYCFHVLHIKSVMHELNMCNAHFKALVIVSVVFFIYWDLDFTAAFSFV